MHPVPCVPDQPDGERGETNPIKFSSKGSKKSGKDAGSTQEQEVTERKVKVCVEDELRPGDEIELSPDQSDRAKHEHRSGTGSFSPEAREVTI